MATDEVDEQVGGGAVSGTGAGGGTGEPVLESAMATGSDEGEPGDHSDGAPPDLEHDRTGDAVEDSPEVVSAAHDDTVLPPSVLGSAEATTAAEDPLSPDFREPGA